MFPPEDSLPHPVHAGVLAGTGEGGTRLWAAGGAEACASLEEPGLELDTCGIVCPGALETLIRSSP